MICMCNITLRRVQNFASWALLNYQTISSKVVILFATANVLPVLVDPCHHGMARPQVADRGTASDKEGSCE